MFKKIVVGFDGSDQGRDALALARLLAAPSGGAVLAVCVYPYEPIYGKGGSGDEAFHIALRADAEKILAEAEGASERTTIGRGSPARGIHDVAEAENADLVVVGSTHHGAIGKVLIGSVGEHLLHGSHCPVAVAPKGFAATEEPSLRRIAMGYNQSKESEAALALATRLAQEAGGTLHLYSAVEPPGANTPVFAGDYGWPHYKETILHSVQERLNEAIAGLPPELEPAGDVLVGRAAEALATEVRSGFDLLVVGSRGYGPIRGVLLGRVSAELARSAPCPVLVVPRSAALPGESPEESTLAAT